MIAVVMADWKHTKVLQEGVFSASKLALPVPFLILLRDARQIATLRSRWQADLSLRAPIIVKVLFH